ncbi:MAG TPA: DUF3798 domain-containing protein [Candidatus Ventricola intestinavium]|nr:DUF3798 domain-containing protein [Candidatus Ventricola intestinavium]
MKKLLCLALAACLCLALAAGAVAEDNWKIAILTGTTSQGEEEFRAAERAVATYGEDHIITDTYPDNFMAETETTISKMVAFASDPDVKAIVMCQAVPGAKAGFDRIREMGRDDILLIAGVPQEDPDVITEGADFVLYTDEAKQGDTIMETCAEWGIDVFVHYSFPRHLAMETIAARKANLEANCEALGIQYVERTAPDPTGDAGTAGAQQFILEDVPAVMEEYAGKKVAFFSTNCSMQEPLQAAVLAEPNAYYPQPCCPSPYHGFPASLGLEIAVGGDDTEALKAIAAKLAESDAVGRFSTWPSPINMTIIDVATEYAKGYIEGTITERNDGAKIAELVEAKCPGAIVSNYTNADGTTFDNYYTILLTPVDFNDYLE